MNRRDEQELRAAVPEDVFRALSDNPDDKWALDKLLDEYEQEAREQVARKLAVKNRTRQAVRKVKAVKRMIVRNTDGGNALTHWLNKHE
ncbi:hypothetical protein LCGC14_2169850 [marine sediment metagenome]|uniref:Uncharacterized protein n=1 Tax=marine sediment metagenome TaxID=412755 RepID=A0A0F9DQJ1_9ZZZZ